MANADFNTPGESKTDGNDIRKLRGTIEMMDALSQEGFSEIAAIATLALTALEAPQGYNDLESIALAFAAIKRKAEDGKNCINFEAEDIGCNYKAPDTERRHLAHYAFIETQRAEVIKMQKVRDAVTNQCGIA